MKTTIRVQSGSNGKNLGDAISRRLWPLESERLCAEARRRTGLKDFGDPPLAPALPFLVNSLEHEADLHPLGRFLMRMHLRDLLETRLRLTEAWRGQFEPIEPSPIRSPIFITGMQRSGSTFLHELLTQDPAHRAPRVWEVMFPVSAGKPDRGWSDSRIRKAAMCLWWFRRLAPRADAVYPMRARTPHECVAIHSYTLLSEEFVSSCRIPSYETFLRMADLSPAYAWEKRFLEHLQYNRPVKRWLLKSPDHSYGMEALFSVFPDALVVQTHRNPLEVLRSSIQMTEVLYGLFAKPIGREQIAEREARVVAASAERFIQFRDAHPELNSRFVDVSYPELAADPSAVVRRIYDQFEMPLSDTAAGRMRQLAQNRSRYAGRRTAPALGDVGIDIPAQARRFSGYCRRFGVSCGPAT